MVDVTQFVNPGTSFNDVAGLEEVKNTLRHIVLYPWGSFEKTEFNVKSNTLSILLYGPSGTGKALLAAATAKECGAKFISIDSANLLFGCTCWTNMNNTDNVKTLFSEAAKNTPSVIFFEGIDNIYPLPCELELSAYNQLLKELDVPRKEVMIIASATKHGKIPWGLFRRFWYRLEVTLPDKKDRREIIQNMLIQFREHAEKNNVFEVKDRSIAIEVLVKATEGFSIGEIIKVWQITQLNSIPFGEIIDPNDKITLKPFNFEIALEEVKQDRKKK
jgi:transitional endoplasmic reticulum ATPase